MGTLCNSGDLPIAVTLLRNGDTLLLSSMLPALSMPELPPLLPLQLPLVLPLPWSGKLPPGEDGCSRFAIRDLMVDVPPLVLPTSLSVGLTVLLLLLLLPMAGSLSSPPSCSSLPAPSDVTDLSMPLMKPWEKNSPGWLPLPPPGDPTGEAFQLSCAWHCASDDPSGETGLRPKRLRLDDVSRVADLLPRKRKLLSLRAGEGEEEIAEAAAVRAADTADDVVASMDRPRLTSRRVIGLSCL